MYWIPFFAIKEHEIFDDFTDDHWQFSEVLGTVFGALFFWLLYEMGGVEYSQLAGASIAILAVVSAFSSGEMKDSPEPWETGEEMRSNKTRWWKSLDMRVAGSMATLFSLTQAFSVNWLRVITFTGEIPLKQGVAFFTISVVAAEMSGAIISFLYRRHRNKCHQPNCGKRVVKVVGSYRGTLECDEEKGGCGHSWSAAIREQWKTPLIIVILGCVIIILSDSLEIITALDPSYHPLDIPISLWFVFIGYLMVIASKAGVLRRVEASDTRHILMGMKGRGGRERFRFFANLLVPPAVLLLPSNMLLGVCIGCSSLLLRLSNTNPRPADEYPSDDLDEGE
jgi:hypothetical protein